jgi:MscS family membrane protein
MLGGESMTQFVEFLNRDIAGVRLGSIGFAFLILIATLVVRKIFDTYIKRGLKKLTDKTRTKYDGLLLDAVSTPLSAVILIGGAYYAVLALKLPSEPYDLSAFATSAFNIAVSAIVIWSLFRVSNFLAKLLMNMFSKMDEEMAENFAPLITQAVKITIVSMGILVVIQNLGYSIGSVLAGLGIGGLAIALAAQDTIANVFGTFVMVIDKPFKKGDWVRFRDIDGDVETIGFRSTKVRTWEKSLKILPNKLLTSEVIENFSEMPKRRVSTRIGIPYSTPPDKVMQLRDEMENILHEDPGVDQDYLFVYFDNFAPSSLELFVYYFTKTTVWKDYLEVRQTINIKFMKAAASLGISFAFPSQTVYFGDSLSIDSRIKDRIAENINS